jgi:hypothetical protein
MLEVILFVLRYANANALHYMFGRRTGLTYRVIVITLYTTITTITIITTTTITITTTTSYFSFLSWYQAQVLN